MEKKIVRVVCGWCGEEATQEQLRTDEDPTCELCDDLDDDDRKVWVYYEDVLDSRSRVF